MSEKLSTKTPTASKAVSKASKAVSQYQSQKSADKRLAESARIIAKYPDRIPVIAVVADSKSNTDLKLTKQKFLVPHDLPVAGILVAIRKQTTLKEKEALFLFVNGLSPVMTHLMSQVYKENKDTSDNFLYLEVSKEETFGT